MLAACRGLARWVPFLRQGRRDDNIKTRRTQSTQAESLCHAKKRQRGTLRRGGGGGVALEFGEDFAQGGGQFVAGNLAAVELDAEMI